MLGGVAGGRRGVRAWGRGGMGGMISRVLGAAGNSWVLFSLIKALTMNECEE